MVDELCEIAGVGPQDFRQCGEVGDTGLLNLVGDNGGRDVHAVQHIAHVMEDPGRYFGHAGLAGQLDEALLRVGQFGMSLLFGPNLVLQLAGALKHTVLQILLGFDQDALSFFTGADVDEAF